MLVERYRVSNEALHNEWQPGDRDAAWTAEYAPARPTSAPMPVPETTPEHVLDELTSIIVAALETVPDDFETRMTAAPERREIRILRSVTPRPLRRRLHLLRRWFAERKPAGRLEATSGAKRSAAR
jgi:hypothetical protein